MVPPIVEPDTTDVAAASPQTPVSPRTPETQEARAPEWPELASFEGIEQEEVERTEWRNYELPPELELFEGDIPQEVQTILRDSLQLVRGNPIDSGLVQIEVEHGEASPANQRRPSNASSAAISDTSGSEGHPRTPSTSSGTLNVPAKLTNGQPTVKMGPLGWIITYPEGEKPKKTKKPKEPKEDSGLIKFLKEKKAERAMGECASCMEDMNNKKLHALACTHKYCSPCFDQLVATAMQNENQFPPKCCLQEIPVKVILASVSHEQREQFKLKAQEYAVPANNRWYCPEPTCAKWIPLNKLKPRTNAQACPHCRVAICGICRGTAHANNEDCPQDFGLDATLEEAEREGWRRCYRCRAMVELTVGCRHITCKCKAEFCYTCGAVWKTCACTELDQSRRQQEILNRRAQRNQQSAAEAQAAAAEAAETAAAIAAVERQEREEEEARQRQEQQRREEEELRRELEAAAARLKEEARVQVLNKKTTEFQALIREIHKTQRDALIARHQEETTRLHADIESSALAFTARQNLLRVTLRQNLKTRIQSLTEEQNQRKTAISSRHEEEEDDLFVRMTTHLRNKPNREAREKSMVDKLKKAQDEEMAALEEEHKAKREELEWIGGIESRSLEDNTRLKREEECCGEGDRVASLVRSVWAQRKWFEAVLARREDMIGEWHERALATGLDLAPRRPTDAQIQAELEATNTRAATILNRTQSQTGNDIGVAASVPNAAAPEAPAAPAASTGGSAWALDGVTRGMDWVYERDPLMQKRIRPIRRMRPERQPNAMYPANELNGRIPMVY